MKKLALLAILTLLNASAFAQPVATVLLNNYDANKPVFYLNAGSNAGADTFAQLLGGPVGGTLAPVTIAGKTDSVFSLADDPGFFDGGVGAVPGVTPGGQAEFQFVAWKGAGSSYQNALERGESAKWQQATGTWDSTPPASPPNGPALNIPGSVVIGPIPEPSTIALGLLGAAALLIRRRK